jgi:hypothetical protein
MNAESHKTLFKTKVKVRRADETEMTGGTWLTVQNTAILHISLV